MENSPPYPTLAYALGFAATPEDVADALGIEVQLAAVLSSWVRRDRLVASGEDPLVVPLRVLVFGTAADGTVFTTFPPGLNAGSGFAGHTDWRLPNKLELDSIVNLANVNPAVSAAFNTNCGANSSGNTGCPVTTCSCNVVTFYWSSSTSANNPLNAWDVSFFLGVVRVDQKNFNGNSARAVRGGS